VTQTKTAEYCQYYNDPDDDGRQETHHQNHYKSNYYKRTATVSELHSRRRCTMQHNLFPSMT